MADSQGTDTSIFRSSAMNHITSADDLDKYIKVTNPSAWVVLLSVACMVIGLIVWSLTAVIPTTVTVTGVETSGDVSCWVDEDTAAKIREDGAAAMVGDQEATNIEVSSTPLSATEVRTLLVYDYLTESVTLSEWNYEVTMNVEVPDDDDGYAHPVRVSIVVSETHPIGLVLGNE